MSGFDKANRTEQPSEVDNARFDYVTGLISFPDEPGLFLRRDFRDGRPTPQEMAQAIDKLGRRHTSGTAQN